ncbi:MAG: helix-turn-helix domain-containing protein [Lachnospiraceae bacterium]|nr:helix-turn-helix domain-containing protein [Lachnospiraceae bacterium]
MANELHITRQAYCNYENGQRTPSVDIIVAIAGLLDVSTDYLLCNKIQ